MKTALRVLSGFAIAVASYVAGARWPQYAWFFGWWGALTYYALTVLPKWWTR